MKKKAPKSYILDNMDIDQKLFRDTNQAYYFSSRFLPKSVREDVSKLYGFLYIAKDYSKNKDTHRKLTALKKSYQNAISDHTFDSIAHKWDEQDVRIVKNIVHLQYKYKFEQAWVEEFLKSLEQDTNHKSKNNIDQILKYMHGSAEVVGYMVAKILNLSEEVHKFVEAQSRAMQWISFINNIAEDSRAGKCYFPTDELKKYGLSDLKEETIKSNQEGYNKFVHFQINRYKKWQSEADKGIGFVPERYQVAIRTAINMDEWIAKKIEKTPTIIYVKTLQPRKRRIFRQIIRNTARGTARVTVRTTKQVRSGVSSVGPTTKAVVPKIKQTPKIVKDKAVEIKDKYIEPVD